MAGYGPKPRWTKLTPAPRRTKPTSDTKLQTMDQTRQPTALTFLQFGPPRLQSQSSTSSEASSKRSRSPCGSPPCDCTRRRVTRATRHEAAPHENGASDTLAAKHWPGYLRRQSRTTHRGAVIHMREALNSMPVGVTLAASFRYLASVRQPVQVLYV